MTAQTSTIPTSPPALRWPTSVSYEEAARRQEELVRERREALILCEHPPTYTLGTGAGPHDLLRPRDDYERMGATLRETPRGGQATYHGPGQLVVYPILNLRVRGLDVHGYLRILEELMIDLCARYDVVAQRIEGKTGIWVEDRKIGFIGIRVRRGFSLHGLSLNVTPQHEPFAMIVPCGMAGLHVTSLCEEAPREVPGVWELAEIAREMILERLAIITERQAEEG